MLELTSRVMAVRLIMKDSVSFESVIARDRQQHLRHQIYESEIDGERHEKRLVFSLPGFVAYRNRSSRLAEHPREIDRLFAI
jgi:hypothetical protein